MAESSPGQSRMKKAITIVVLLVLAAGGIWYWTVWSGRQAVQDVQVQPPSVVLPEPEPPTIEFPVGVIEAPAPPETGPPPVPLPALEDSDAELIEHGAALVGADALEQNFVLDMIVNRLVATVDGLTSAQVPPLMLPVKPVPGNFAVQESGEEVVISPQNSERYAPYVALIEQADMDHMVALYVRYYPLLQSAYTDLGYPDGYFNDRLVEVIDHLLAAPEPENPPALRKVEAVYVYEDPKFENLSAGQKALVRMGTANALKVKDKLRQIRAEITGAALTD